ncbi:MAG: type IV toxin-antitoxin system AbiEi family antitoxin domain-containing protein [Ignavibacteria bacterium]
MIYNITKYLDYNTLLEEFAEYKSPKAKITNLIKSGEVIKVKRDLFIAGITSKANVNILANIIYNPSYISFEYALNYYGLIPERVDVITSATFNKNKNRAYETELGVFEYRYMSKSVYPYGIVRVEENGEPFLIASKEKALCDTLSKIRSVESVKKISYLLYEDLRIDKEQLQKLNEEDIKFYSEIYTQPNIKLFYKLLLKLKQDE